MSNVQIDEISCPTCHGRLSSGMIHDEAHGCRHYDNGACAATCRVCPDCHGAMVLRVVAGPAVVGRIVPPTWTAPATPRSEPSLSRELYAAVCALEHAATKAQHAFWCQAEVNPEAGCNCGLTAAAERVRALLREP